MSKLIDELKAEEWQVYESNGLYDLRGEDSGTFLSTRPDLLFIVSTLIDSLNEVKNVTE